MLCIWHYNSLGLLLGHMLSGIFFKFILTFEYTRQNCQLASILAINRIKICANFFSTHSTSISSLLVFAFFIDPYWLFSQLNTVDCIFVPPHFCSKRPIIIIRIYCENLVWSVIDFKIILVAKFKQFIRNLNCYFFHYHYFWHP